MNNNSIKIFVVFSLLSFVWGSTWLAIKIGLESLTPFISAGLRFSVASAVIFLIMKLKNIRLQLDSLSVRLYLLMGFFSFIIPFGLVYWAEQFVPSGLASVLFGVYPFFVALFSFFMLKNERLGLFKLSGMIIGFFGIVIIFSDSFSGNLSNYIAGMIAVMLSAIMQASIAVILKKYGNNLHSLSMNFIPMMIAGSGLLLIGFLAEDTSGNILDLRAIGSILYLALFGSIFTFTSFYWLMKKVNVVLLSLLAFITPVVALILGWIFYSEQLLEHQIAGSVLVLIGLLIANLGSLVVFRKKKILKF